MRRNILVGALALGLGTALSVLAQPQADSGGPTPAPQRLRVDISPQEDRLNVEYVFPAKARAIPLETRPAVTANITGEPGFTINAAGLAWLEAAPSRSIEVRPDAARTSAEYPVLTRVGDGWLVFLPALTADPEADDIRYKLPHNWIVREGPGLSPRMGFVFIGPSEAVDSRFLGLIVDPVVSADIVNLVRSETTSTLNELESKLGVARPSSPLVAVSSLPALSREAYVGDVTPNGVVNLQFQGSAQLTEALREEVRRLVAHEMFHVWNGRNFTAAEPGEGRWLTEGSAEYAALRLTEGASPAETIETVNKLVHSLNNCLEALPPGTGVAAARGDLAEAIRYSCGVAVQWLTDLKLRAEHPDESYFSVWGSLFRQPAYTTEDFRQRFGAGKERSNGLHALLDGDLNLRSSLRATLEKAGVPIALVPPSNDLWILSIAQALHQNLCPDVGGVGGADGRWRLYASSDCRGLGTQPTIMSVLGVPLADGGPDLFEMVRQKCETAEPVEVTLYGTGKSETRDVQCSSMPKPPQARFEFVARAKDPARRDSDNQPTSPNNGSSTTWRARP